MPARFRRSFDPLSLQRLGLSWLGRALTYLVLAEVTYVFLYPVVYMASTSFKSPADLYDLTVYWIPTELYVEHYDIALEATNYFHSLRNSVITSLPAAIGQVLICSFVAYGFARIPFPGRDLMFLLVIFTFVIPPQTVVVPLFFLYLELGWLNTYWPWIAPAWLAHGVKGAIFVLIFRQFFRGLPVELEDAAFVDGAGRLRVFWQIILPLASPAILVVFLFSLVWHWNDVFMPTVFLHGGLDNATLPSRLLMIVTYFFSQAAGKGDGVAHGAHVNDGLMMAATVLVVLPQILIYIFLQRYFVESIDRTGLVE